MTDQGTLIVQTEPTDPVVQTDPGTVGTETPKRKKPGRGFNVRIGEAELLAEAMTANQEKLASGGGGEEYVNQLKGLIGEIKTLNQDQERYKAEVKGSTTQILLKMKTLGRMVRKGRSIVKNEIDQARWVEFGIRAIW